MNTTDDNKSVMVRTSSTALARRESQALARRGLHDLEITEQKIKEDKCCPKDEARPLFCLDHQCTHDRCPDVLHLDFALIPIDRIRPEKLGQLIQDGRIEREYYVFPDDAGWHVIHDSEVGWQSESLPDGTVLLKTPDLLLGALHGPFFSKSEAAKFAEEKRRENHNQVVTLPRIIPHLWCSDGCCSICGESDPAQNGRSCAKRSCNTWYEVLGVPENANEDQIKTAYRELVEKWDPQRLQHPD